MYKCAISRRKNPSLTYKLTERKNQCNTVSWVVKFSPKDKQDDLWYDVSLVFKACITVHITHITTTQCHAISVAVHA